MLTQEMLDSIKRVEASRPQRIGAELKRMSAQEKDELLFMELQADNDHSADILLQAAREHTGLTKARLLLAENQFLYLGEGKHCGYGMICYLGQPFPVTDVYFRLLL